MESYPSCKDAHRRNALSVSLKESFNNVKSEIHDPTCYQCLWYGEILKPKKIALQNDQEASKK